ncbi:MAG: hypothetical protein ACOH10_08725 [Rhodoglobus sp.]
MTWPFQARSTARMARAQSRAVEAHVTLVALPLHFDHQPIWNALGMTVPKIKLITAN